MVSGLQRGLLLDVLAETVWNLCFIKSDIKNQKRVPAKGVESSSMPWHLQKYKSSEKCSTQKQKQEGQEIHFQGELEDFGRLPP